MTEKLLIYLIYCTIFGIIGCIIKDYIGYYLYVFGFMVGFIGKMILD